MKASTLSPSDVRRIFNYDDGVLYWAVSNGPRAAIGTRAGTLQKKSNTHIITANGTRSTRARLVFAWHHGAWPSGYIIHCNRDSCDDRIENLIDYVSPEYPAAVQPIRGHLIGVVPVPGGWRARHSGDHIGTFKSEAEAHAAFKHAHGMKYAAAALGAS